MLKLLFGLMLAAATAVQAQNWQNNYVSSFCGLSTLNDSSQLQDCETPDAQNVLTDNGGMEKRPGNVRIAQILNGFAVKFVSDFVAPSATRYVIAHASNTIYQTNLTGSPVALSTAAAGFNISMISAYGKAIFQDGSGTPWSWDGNSTATVSGMPIGKYMLFADERVYVANIPGSSGAQVSVSSFGSVNYFTVPGNVSSVADAPNAFTFQKDDGEAITCARVTPWGKVFGKRHSMWIIKGYDNLTYYKRNVDPKIGCIDDRAMQMVDGLLVWLAVDGIWAWPGSGPPQLISKDILPTVAEIRQINSAAAQWIVDTQADFQAGAATGNGPIGSWDSASQPASIFPSSTTYGDSNGPTWALETLVNLSTISIAGAIAPVQAGSGTFINAGAESNSASINWSQSAGAWTASNIGLVGMTGQYGSLAWESGDDPGCVSSLRFQVLDVSSNVLLSPAVNPIGSGVPRYFTVDTSTLTQSMIKLRVTYRPGTNPVSDMYSYPFVRPDHLAIMTQIVVIGANCRVAFDTDESSMTLNGSATGRIFDTFMSTPVYGPFLVDQSTTSNAATVFTTQVATSATSTTFDAAQTSTPGAQILSAAKRAVKYKMTYSLAATTSTFQINSISLTALSTGIYYSPVHFIGSAITSWGAANFTDVQAVQNSLSYHIRAATSSFLIGDLNPAWSLQANNVNITVATGTYVQWYVDSSSITSSSMTSILSRAAINWQEGSSILMASGVLNHRFFLCGEFSPTATANDMCLILQKNNKWIPWSGPVPSAMGRYNDQLIVGDGSSNSYIWKVMQDGVYQDDGFPINAYWTSKDFTLEKPFQQKILHETWVDGVRFTSSTLSVGYAVDKSTAYITRSFGLDAAAAIVSHRIPYTSGFALGKYMKFKLSNALIDQTFKINNYMYRTETKDIINE